MKSVVFVSNDARDREVLYAILPKEYRLVHHGHGSIARISDHSPCLVILDPPTTDPLASVAALVDLHEAPPIAVVSKRLGQRDLARAIRRGAFDCLPYPFRASDLRQTLLEAQMYRAAGGIEYLLDHPALEAIVGTSESIRRLRERVCRIAQAELPVLVSGESGTGKELIARAVHALSPRQARPFIAVNCGAIPEQLFESEFFGAAKGAFTDARDRMGHFEHAHNGTLFLDEVGDLPLFMQAKLLRVLEEGVLRRIGDHQDRPVSPRIVAATNRDLRQAVRNETFRSDLYYRLNVVPLRAPSLRERREDISMLVRHFAGASGSQEKPFTPGAIERLMNHSWPGNVRELRNVVERALCLTTKRSIGAVDIEL